MCSVLPHIELEDLWNTFFWLTYKRAPNGTGTNLTRNDLLEMDMEEILWHWKFLWDVWDKENEAERRSGGR